ncbi:hypothetical protein [Sphingopyxis sp. NJF-3]
MTKRLVLGDLGEGDMEVAQRELIILPQRPIFKPIATFVTAVAGFSMLAEAHNSQARTANVWPRDDTAIFGAMACGLRLSIAPYEIADRMVKNWWPDRLVFQCFADAAKPPTAKPHLGAIEHYLFGLSQAMLTSYFEDHRQSIEAAHGKKPGGWPAVWNFARVVRNALSHGGALDIRNATSVQWRTLAYTQADHGKAVIFTDIWPGDLIMLMHEMDAALSASSSS